MIEQPVPVGTRGELQAETAIDTAHSEEIHIRNFDTTQSYDLTLSVCMDDETVLSNTYHLTPGRRISEIYQLPPGVYDVEVTLDSRQRETARCEIGSAPERTALIEIGNGTVSVTQGLC